MKSTKRKKANKLSSDPPDARDHDAGHLDGRTVNTLRVDDDGDEPTVDQHGRVWPTPPDDALPSEIVLPRLDLVRKVDDTTYMARCSAHRDNTPSLSVRVTNKYDLLLHCFAGCTLDSICAALGLSVAHLFATDYARRRRGCGSRKSPTPAASRETVDSDGPPDPKFQALSERFQAHPDRNGYLAQLADLLGVPRRVLRRLGLGWVDRPERWSIPERDDLGRVVGISFRHVCGTKTSASGGKRGLVVPDRPAGDGPLYVCEGMSDTAALLAAGRRAIGRPNAFPSALARAWLAKVVTAATPDTPVIVVGDRDDAGRDGASSLSDWLADECGRPVRWALPRAGFKDVREQWQATGSVGLKLQSTTRR